MIIVGGSGTAAFVLWSLTYLRRPLMPEVVLPAFLLTVAGLRRLSLLEAWLDNSFAFDLGERNGLTLLTFTQDYARDLEDEVYGRFNFNWGYYLQSLVEFCETGTGFPFSAE